MQSGLTPRSAIPGAYHTAFFRRLLCAAAASVCFSLGAMALALSVSDLASVSARVWMQGWEKDGRIEAPEQWGAAYRRLRLARRLHPLDAEHSADLGRLMEWQSWERLSDARGASESRDSAGRYYEESLGKRPGWGYAWAHYAENRLLAGKPDEIFVTALDHAVTLAPWEPGVQRKVAWMGMAAWDALPDFMRAKVQESIQRSVLLETNLEEIVRLAVQYGWLERLQPMMRSDRQLRALDRVLGHAGRR